MTYVPPPGQTDGLAKPKPVPYTDPPAPVDATTTPEAWRDRLIRRLDERTITVQKLIDYHAGRHPLAFASPKFREAFGGLFRAFSDNFCELVVDATKERLKVQGFRLDREPDPDTGKAVSDPDAWRIWQNNNLDAESDLAHEAALVTGYAYAIVWSRPDKRDEAYITIESPLEVIVDVAPGDRRRRRAALKRWVDDDGYHQATLYLPDGIYKWKSENKPSAGARVDRWNERRGPEDEEWPIPLPTSFDGAIPVVPIPNRPDVYGHCRSELDSVTGAQDAINKLAADMLVAAEYAAYRQRYILNLDLDDDPETGQPRAPFKAGTDRTWIFGTPDRDDDPNTPEVKVGEFGISDLSPYIKAIEMWVQHVATRTRTPAHYMLGQSGSFPSGESLKSTETGLVAKVREKMVHIGEAWEEVIRLGLLVEGLDAKAAIRDSETLWRDPETRTEAEHTDAVVKKGSAPINVPQEILWAELGYSPQEIERMKAMQERDAMLAAAAVDPFAAVPDLANPSAPSSGLPGPGSPRPSGSRPIAPAPPGGAGPTRGPNAGVAANA